MSMYTTPLRAIVERYSQWDDHKTRDERIEIARPKIFDFDYPMFDDDFKSVFETNFIKDFYTREIGFETEELFKQKLEAWLLMNMDYYNSLFESERLHYDPLINFEMVEAKDGETTTNRKDNRTIEQLTDTEQTDDTDETSSTKRDEDTSQDTTTEQKYNTKTKDRDMNRNVHSDNPDSRLRLHTKDEGKGIIEYASDITEDKLNHDSTTKGDTTTDTKSQTDSDIDTDVTANTNREMESTQEMNHDEDYKRDVETLDNYLQRNFGKIGVRSYADMVMEYRRSLIRVQRQIHNELSQLFMLVY